MHGDQRESLVSVEQSPRRGILESREYGSYVRANAYQRLAAVQIRDNRSGIGENQPEQAVRLVPRALPRFLEKLPYRPPNPDDGDAQPGKLDNGLSVHSQTRAMVKEFSAALAAPMIPTASVFISK
jgi:hypothetical protein